MEFKDIGISGLSVILMAIIVLLIALTLAIKII